MKKLLDRNMVVVGKILTIPLEVFFIFLKRKNFTFIE